VALIVVLLLVALLSVAVSEFAYEVRINAVLTRNNQDKLQARYVAKAGVNAAKGLLVHSAPFDNQNRGSFQNDYINFFHCECYSGGPMGPELGLTDEQVEEQEELLFSKSNCGSWSLDINYPIEDNFLNLRITDEQSRINLNALVRRSMNPEEKGMGENVVFRPVLFELFSMRLRQLNIEATDEDVNAILDIMEDWLDYGTYKGSFDDDFNEYYEDGDRMYSNKNGPMDTVSEIKMLPGMTDEFYNGIKDLVTVYPLRKQSLPTPSPRVNVHLAGQEVLFALFRGASYDGGDWQHSEEVIMNLVNEIIKSGIDENGFLKNRNLRTLLPQDIRNSIKKFKLKTNLENKRFYRIHSSGLTPNGIIHTIETVIRVETGEDKLIFVYWREE
jgi:type II secretory pathway component PulK